MEIKDLIKRCEKCKYKETLKSRDARKVCFEVCTYTNESIKPWTSNILECPLNYKGDN